MKKINTWIKNNKNKIIFHIVFVIIFSILLIIDDYLFKIFNNANQVQFGRWCFWGLLIGTVLSLVENRKFVYTMLGIYCFLDLTQLGYMAYFNNIMPPFAIPLLFIADNSKDVLKSFIYEFSRIWYAPFCVLIPYFFSFFIYKKYNGRLFKIKYFWIILILILLHFPIRAYRVITIARTLPSYERPSLYNGIKTYSSYFFNILLKGMPQKSFKPYKLEKIIDEKKDERDINIIIVYGESYSWHQSSLFGWENKTSPLLEQFAKEDKRFKYKDGISCAIFTATSIPSFFNMYMEPENFKEQITKTGNLFSIAKKNNFTTYWLSIQSTSLINNLNIQDMDYIVNYNNEKAIIDELEDDATLKFLKRYDLENGSNFMVLHQGNMHTPYLQYRIKHPEFKVFENEYENAQLYEDYLIYDILTYLKTLKKPTFFFLISDHGSGGGFNGNYGNLSLNSISSDVPVMMWTNFNETNITNKFDKMWKPHCHQLGSLIMEIMGYKIINPNQVDSVYYINGTDLFGRHGYTKIIKDEKNKTIKYESIIP